MGYNRIIIFGAGKTGVEALRFYGKQNVYCFVDNYKSGSIVEGLDVISVDELIEIQNDFELVVALYATNFNEATNQLSDLGIKFKSYYEDVIDYSKSLKASRQIKKIQALRNSGKGKTICLIGNGPSLKSEDLEKIQLAGIKTMACNFINKLYTKTNWRPDYYCCFEESLLVENKDYIMNDKDLKYKFIKYSIHSDTQDLYSSNLENLLILKHYYNPEVDKYDDLNDDIAKSIGTRYTVMYGMLKIALYCGYDEILLIGVDNTMPPTVHAKKFVEAKTHFYDEDVNELEKEKNHG